MSAERSFASEPQCRVLVDEPYTDKHRRSQSARRVEKWREMSSQHPFSAGW